MAFCGSCGNQLANDERFCTKCGAEQGAKADDAPEAAATPAGLDSAPRAAAPEAGETAGRLRNILSNIRLKGRGRFL